jgi:hypothetical protein
MRRDCGIEKRLSKRLKLRKGAFFVAAHQTAVPGDIRRQHSRQSPFNAFVRQKPPKGGNSTQNIKAYGVAAPLGPEPITEAPNC